MTVLAMCESAKVSRAGFYRQRTPRPAEKKSDIDLRNEIQKIALEFPCYGRRRFVITTDSNPPHPIYPNLAAAMEVTAVINSGWRISPTYAWRRSSFIWP